jgi:ubiquinone/menaquinone biosynthesis C-methylase UbiE
MLPVTDGWADVVISNGVINLCADKQAVFAEIYRCCGPAGNWAGRHLQFGHRYVPARAHPGGGPSRWATSWHTWRTGTPARSAAARMQATAA